VTHNLVEVHYLAGQLPEAAALLGRVDPEIAPPECLYYRGLALAASGDFVTAEQCFQSIVSRSDGGGDFDGAARQVLAKILSARAVQQLKANNIAKAVDDLRQAIALSKETSKQYSLLMALTLQAGFAYLQEGRFADALREWRETQAQEPQNLQVAHSLAVVCYRLASETEAQHNPANDAYWRDAIANWVMVIFSDSFWSAWGNGRTGALGPIDAAIIKEVRDKTGSRLRDDFREFRTQYLTDPSHSADADRHARFEADLVREMHAAEAMMKAIQEGNPAGRLVQVVCGPLMLERWRQIPGAARLVEAVDALANVTPELRRYLSDLGVYDVMIHDLKRYDDARAGLEKLMSGKKKTDEAKALLVEAYLAQANELVEAQSFDKALPLLEKAAGYDRDQAKTPLAQVATKLAHAIFDGDTPQPGIDLLERLMKAFSITDTEFKAELSLGYFKRGLQRNHNDDNRGALADLKRALEINPDNERAKQNMGAVIMNLAAEELKADRSDAAFKLVMDAFELKLDNLGEYREFVSIVFFRHAIDMANKAISAVQYSSFKQGACPALKEAKTQLEMALELAKPDDYSYRANIQKQLTSIKGAIAQLGCW
jgi:tetratricopeptide (TPR) repeat protein